MATKGLNFGIDFKGGTKIVVDFGKDFEAKILNTGEMVHSMAEFISVAGKYV